MGYLEKVTLPGGREIYYNYEDANAFMSLGRVANIAANGSPDDANTYVAYKYLGGEKGSGTFSGQSRRANR